MRKTLLTFTAFGLLSLAACDRNHAVRIRKSVDDLDGLRSVSSLACPDHKDMLTRVRTAPDGLSCDYTGPRGTEVTLRLVKLDPPADPQITLQPIEDALAAYMPQARARLAADAHGDSDGDKADADPGEASAEADADADDHATSKEDADKVEADGAKAHPGVHIDTDNPNEKTDVDMPGFHVHAKGDKATVDMPGLKVHANNGGAQVDIGPIHIKADDDKGRVSINSRDNDVQVRSGQDATEVRARKAGKGFQSSYLLVDDRAGNPWRAVGYEAAGPAEGPLVVAVVKSRDAHDEGLFSAAKALVRANVGGD